MDGFTMCTLSDAYGLTVTPYRCSSNQVSLKVSDLDKKPHGQNWLHKKLLQVLFPPIVHRSG